MESNNNIFETGEKILFQRANPPKSIVTNPYLKKFSSEKRNTQGVLVIDPNKVVNKYNQIIDRYVKQEDLVIYSSLKVIKRGERSVIVGGDGVKSETIESQPIFINFLNPLKNRRKDGTFDLKGKMTTEWTDFFTSDDANDKENSKYILDPETFGITDIGISINAGHIPIVTIQFTDVQGRMLFERGNENDNPYNIFFTYPYPRFLLTYKGYYGKAVETSLVLLKSNTRFDPETGNYNVTAEFQSEVFSIFNTFLMIYAYVAPYMFLLDSGEYLGQKILNSLYEKQNKEIKELVGNDPEAYKHYEILNNPTMFDLAGAVEKIAPSALQDASIQTKTSSASNDKVSEIKYKVEEYNRNIRNWFENNCTVEDNNQYKPKPGVEFLTDTTPIELINNYSTLNELIKSIDTVELPSSAKNNTSSEIFSEVVKDVDILYNNKYKPTGNKDLIQHTLFFGLDYNDKNVAIKNTANEKIYTIDNYDRVISLVLIRLNELQSTIEESFVDDQISDLGTHLGYEPNMNNVLRIVANNMQTFLILLEITANNAIKQLQVDNLRTKKQAKFTDYIENDRKHKIFTPFPNYFKNKVETFNNNGEKKEVKRNILTYPGIDDGNKDWFEVAFVEEIYLALNRITVLNNPKAITNIATKKTGLSTILGLGENDLDAYLNKKQSDKLLGEMITKYNLYATYSGMYYRGLGTNGLADGFSKKLADFELALLEELVFDKMDSSNAKFVTASELYKITKKGDITDINGATNTYTNLGNLAINGLRLKAPSDAIFFDMVTKTINLYATEYTQADFTNSIKNKNKLVSDNIINSYLYELISFKDVRPLYYSMSSKQKINYLDEYPDLTSNLRYYCDKFETLIPIAETVKTVEVGQEDSNPFQGFIKNLNAKLKSTPLPIDFGRTVKYGNTEVPALTFNSKLSEAIEVFNPVTYTGKINSAKFNNI
jgi:hypothetical protein